MPKNYFKDRPRYSHYPNCIVPGDQVMIVTKDKQGTKRMEDLISGIVVRVLSKGKMYPNGVKVEIISFSSDWTPEQRRRYVEEIKDSLKPDQLPFVQSGKKAIGRIQYFVPLKDS